MANEGGGKIKSKRSHGSKPYARRQSLLGRVYEFLKPSWLMEMVGSSNLELDDKDEDDQEQHYSSPFSSHNVQPTYKHVDTPRPSLTRPYREPLGQQPASNQLTTPIESNFHQVSESTNSIDRRDINGDDYSECSESTSGCSSMLPHPDKRDYQKEILQDGISHPVQTNAWNKNKIIDEHSQQQQHSGFVTRDTSRSQKHYRGLWSIEDPILSRPQPSAQDPSISFNVSAFGTSLLPENSSIFGDSVFESPFYSGKTKYGGAANHRKDRLQTMSPYYRVTPVRQQVKVKIANNSETGEFGMTSNTARRILEVLETMSTPLSDAKKIPRVNNRIPDTPLSFMPGFHKQDTSDSSYKINHMALKPGPPINSINTPNRAVISKNLQSLIPAKTINLFLTKKSNQNMSSMKTMVNNIQKPDSEIFKNRGAGGKMKTSRCKENQHYASKVKAVEEEVYEVQDLPKVTLPIKNLPQFNFETSTLSTAATTSSLVFAFSTPIAPAGPTCSITGLSSTAPFTFSSPLPAPEAISRSTTATSFSNVNFKYTTSSSVLKLKENSALETKGLSKKCEDSENELTGFKPASEIKSGSVSDVLSQDWGNKFKHPAGSWQCPSCCINNKAELKSCAACQTTKPQSKSDGQKLIDSSNSISHTFNGWECIKCHTKNNSNTVCNNCKHSGFNNAENSPHFKLFDSSGAISVEDSNSKGFGDKFKPLNDSWECSSCFVRNELKDSKCIACDSFKPGTSTVAIKQSNNSATVGFGSQFAKPKDMWECDICLVLNKTDALSCVACQSVKPGNMNEPTNEVKFSFKSKEDGNTDNVGFTYGNTNANTAKSDVTFGISTNNQNTTKTDSNSFTGFSFGAKTVTSVSESNGFSFTKANSSPPSSTPTFQFGSTSTSKANIFTYTKPSNSPPAITDSNSAEEVKPKESEKPIGGFPFAFNQAKKEDNQSNSTEGFKFSIPNTATTDSSEKKSTTGFSFVKPQNPDDSGSSFKPPPSGGFSFGLDKPLNASVTNEPAETIVIPIEAKQSDNSSESVTKPSFTFGSQAQTNNASSGFQFSFNANGHYPGSKHKLNEDSGPENKKKIASSRTSGFSFASSTANTSATTTTSTLTTSSQAPSFTFTSSVPSFNTTSTATTNSKNTTPIFSNTSTATTSSSTFPPVTSISNTTSSFPFKPTTTTTSQSTSFSFTPATTSTSGFGAATFTTSASSAPSFTFSAQSNAGQTANITNTTVASTAPTFGFSFTNPVPAASGFAISTGTPVFGATTVSSTPAFGTTTVSATPAFGTTNASTPAFGTVNTQGSTAPTFGFTNPTTTAAPMFGSVTPTFGSTNPGAFNTGTATSSSTPFGSLPSITTAPSGFPFTSTSSFTFGQQSAPPSVFSFSGHQAPVASPPTSQQQPAVSFNFGNQANLSSTPNFNFGATQQTSAPFQFSATPNPPSNPFSIASTGSRKIKKAVRKLRNKLL